MAPMMFELDAQAVMACRLPKAQALPRQLPVQRDLAVIVADAVTHDQVLAAALGAEAGAEPSLLRNVQLFDLFKPSQGNASMAAGEKSLALRLTLADDEQTLTDTQIDAQVQAVVARLQAQLAARLRA